MITIDIDKARAITKDRLRRERAPLLAALDVEYLRALENNADTSSTLAEKQRLRDVTNLVNNINTIEELKEISL